MTRSLLAAAILFAGLLATRGQSPPPTHETLKHLPVREVTVFKDGYAFVVHRGSLPVTSNGQVVLDYLPTPVLGTFWPASLDPKVRLRGVTAGRRRVKLHRTAMTLRELLEANVGTEVVISERPAGSGDPGRLYAGKILGFLNRSSEELAASAPPHAEEALGQKGNLILLYSPDGYQVLPVESIASAKFRDEPRRGVTDEEFRHVLTLQFDWGDQPQAQSVDIGMAYLQRGLRWVPNYRIDLDGQGQASLQLQAMLINELTDLDNVTLHLVIGVPSFFFKETLDPIAMNQTLAQLSQHFRHDASTQQLLSNTLMTQATRMTEVGGAERGAAFDLVPAIADSTKQEDLFLFTLSHVSLKKGERMSMPVATVKLPYKDVFTLELPIGKPPLEGLAPARPAEEEELRRLLAAPKVQHRVRLTNSSPIPLTTAPAMIFKEGKLLAQGVMTYTPAGAVVDVTITTAVDIKFRKSDTEVRRTPKSLLFEDKSLTRIDLTGQIELTNLRSVPVEVEVTRYVAGKIDRVDGGGSAVALHEEDEDDTGIATRLARWHGYPWTAWGRQVNGVGRVRWTVGLEPGKSTRLNYDWHYFGP